MRDSSKHHSTKKKCRALHGSKQLSLLDNLNYKTSRKDEIIEYLKNKNEFYDGVRCSTLKDLVKQENTHLPTYAYFDGVYFWTDEDTYHFEKYDMRLNDEFVNHVLKALDSGKKED